MRVFPPWQCGFMITIALLGTIASAGVPTGLPIGAVEEGQWTLGLEYGYDKTDLEASGMTVRTLGAASYAGEFIEIEDLEANMVFASLAYGVCDNWDLFLRLGASDARDDLLIGSTPASGLETSAYDGGYGLAWGLGTRATFCHWGPWRFGGTVQVTWFDPKESDFLSTSPTAANTVYAGSADLDFWQTQIALAAVYQIDTLTFWAGPLLQFTEGDLTRKGRIVVDGTDSGSFRGAGEIKESAQFGAHIGVSWEISPKLNCHVQGQFTSDSWFTGAGLVIQPGGFFSRN